MERSQTLLEALDRPLSRAVGRIDTLRTSLLAVSAASSKGDFPWRMLSLDVRANAIVYGIAELEAFIKTIVVYAHSHVNLALVPLSDIKPCMRRLAAHDRFTALRDLSDSNKVWTERLYATTLESQSDVVQLPVTDVKHAPPPLDGRTPSVRHFNLIWEVYGLPGSPFPVLPWLGTFRKLTSARNDLAHGNVPYDEFFLERGYDFVDVERYLDHLEAFMTHYAETWDEYITKSGWLAQSPMTEQAVNNG